LNCCPGGDCNEDDTIAYSYENKNASPGTTITEQESQMKMNDIKNKLLLPSLSTNDIARPIHELVFICSSNKDAALKMPFDRVAAYMLKKVAQKTYEKGRIILAMQALHNDDIEIEASVPQIKEEIRTKIRKYPMALQKAWIKMCNWGELKEVSLDTSNKQPDEIMETFLTDVMKSFTDKLDASDDPPSRKTREIRAEEKRMYAKLLVNINTEVTTIRFYETLGWTSVRHTGHKDSYVLLNTNPKGETINWERAWVVDTLKLNIDIDKYLPNMISSPPP
jgi:hypothetical protein